MSKGVTPTVNPPIVIARFVDKGVVIPIRCANNAVRRVPTLT
jgi:hypothetical protein